MNTPIIENLLPRLRETVATQMKNYLGGEGELSGIYESLEFWWDGIRDREFPELPMWSELPTPDRDRLFDEWIEAVEDFISSRGKPVGPSNASGAGAPSAGTDVVRDGEEKIEEMWKQQKGVRPDTGEAWLTPRMERNAAETVKQWELHGAVSSHPALSAADQSFPVPVAPSASSGFQQTFSSPSLKARDAFVQWWHGYCTDPTAGYSAGEKFDHMQEAFVGGFNYSREQIKLLREKLKDCEKALERAESAPDASCASPAPLVPEVVKAVLSDLEMLQNWRTDAVLGLGEYDQGLMCGVEDRGLQKDGYSAMRYGYDAAIARVEEQIDETIVSALAALRSYSPVPSPSVELLREARKALDDLLRSSKRVSDKGAKTGPQWTDLTCSLLSARPTLEKLNAVLA